LLSWLEQFREWRARRQSLAGERLEAAE